MWGRQHRLKQRRDAVILAAFTGLFFLVGCDTRAEDENTPPMGPPAANDMDMDITVATINLLHGFRCDDPPAPAASANQCRLADRVALLFQWLLASGCPDIVTLQEIVDEEFVPGNLSQQARIGPLDSAVDLIAAQLGAAETACGFRYGMVFDKAQGIDEELILTRYPIQTSTRFDLHSVFQAPQLLD